MSKTPSLYQNLKQLFSYAQRTNTPLRLFIIPFVLVIAASFFEAASVSLLIPLLKGIIAQDFSSLRELPILGDFINRRPNVFPSGNRNLIGLLVLLTFSASLLKTVFQYVSSLMIAKQVRGFANRMRQLVYGRVLEFGKLYFDSASTGKLFQILTGFVGAVTQTFQGIQGAIFALLTLLLYVGLMFYISWQLTLVVLAIFPVLHYALRTVIDKIRSSSNTHAQSLTRLSTEISNSLASISLIKAYRNEEYAKDNFRTLSSRVADVEFSMDKKTYFISPCQEVISLFFLLLLVILIGVFVSLEGDWNVAEYMVFIVILRRTSVMFGTFNNIRTSLAGVSGPLRDIDELFDDKEKHFVYSGQLEFPGLQSNIRFQNVTFQYGDSTSALTDVSFSIDQGKITALVGHSGSGKSTVTSLLMRFYDSPPGVITADGKDIREYSLDSWRKCFALVSQESVLFNASLRENLVFGLVNKPTESELKEALARARLTDLIEQLPEGLETFVGDRGVKLSGGEKQRVSIARAILKNAEVLLLDEATSALDSVTERLIQEALDELVVGRTTLVVAHRLSTIKHADLIVVLDGGRVVEQGTLSELLDKKGKFHLFWEEQRFSM